MDTIKNQIEASELTAEDIAMMAQSAINFAQKNNPDVSQTDVSFLKSVVTTANGINCAEAV